jgi:asparaginyl-tRNA synthetase
MTNNVHSISDLLAGKVASGNKVVVNGWVKTRRDSKAGISFIATHDGSCFAPIQVVAPNTLSNYNEDILRLTAGCSLSVTGQLVDSPAQGQAFEIQAEKIEVLGFVENPESYPIQPKHHTLEYLREVMHLRPRTNTISAVTRVRHSLAQAIHRFFDEKGFYWIHTPIITTNDCEGAGELLRVGNIDLQNVPKTLTGEIDFSQDFFGKEAFLTVSGQLNVECFCLAMSKVYTFSPAFRAENSNTSRHLAEFWMVEPEIAFADLKDINQLSEELLRYVIKTVLDERTDDMAFFNDRIDKECIERLELLLSSPFEVMDYTKAVEILEKAPKKFEFPVYWGGDLQSEHERYLAEEYVKRPVIVNNYPKEIKSFYMRLNDDNKTVAAMDLLVPGMGELIGGSQREERLDKLVHQMKTHNLSPEQYSWYCDLRRYGTTPHAGFGMGFERLICYVTGLKNLRDVIPFPRTVGHATY